MMHGAIHGLDIIFDPFHFHGGVHALLVVRQVPAADEEIFLGDMRCAHRIVAVGALHFSGQLFQLLDDHRAARRPQGQAGTYPLGKCE